MRLVQSSPADDLAAAQSGRPEETVVANLVDPGRRDQDGQPFQQLQRLKDHVGGPVPPATLEAVEEAAVRTQGQSPVCQRGAAGVAAEPLESPAIPRGDRHLGVDRRTAEGDAEGAGGASGLVRVDLVAETQDLLPRPPPRRDPAADRGRGEQGEEGILRRQRVGQDWISAGAKAAAPEKTRQSPLYPPGNLLHLGSLEEVEGGRIYPLQKKRPRRPRPGPRSGRGARRCRPSASRRRRGRTHAPCRRRERDGPGRTRRSGPGGIHRRGRRSRGTPGTRARRTGERDALRPGRERGGNVKNQSGTGNREGRQKSLPPGSRPQVPVPPRTGVNVIRPLADASRPRRPFPLRVDFLAGKGIIWPASGIARF